MEIPILKDIIIILGLAVFVLLVCHCLRIPSIVGFLLTGVLAGPHGGRGQVLTWDMFSGKVPLGRTERAYSQAAED